MMLIFNGAVNNSKMMYESVVPGLDCGSFGIINNIALVLTVISWTVVDF